MEEDKRALIHPGSLLNSSEGLLSGGAMAALIPAMRSDDWRVACAACLGIAIVGATYCIMRQKAKIAELG
jgi:hypothetical protein